MWALHSAAIKRWSTGALEAGTCAQDEIARQSEVIIVELDRLASLLPAMVVDYLRRERPAMAGPARQRQALRAAQVGVLRLGLGETYVQIAARPEINGGLRSLESAYALLVDAYLDAWRRQDLPGALVPVAGSHPER